MPQPFKQRISRLFQSKRHSKNPGRLPTFLVIGAAKAGTTSLYHYLNSHPSVYMSPVKEPHFFSYQGNIPDNQESAEATRLLPKETARLQTLEDYSKLFVRARPKHLAVGEASTGYLCGSSTPDIVRQQLPNVKLIAILRNPVERAWSEFRMMRRFGEEPDSTLLDIIRQRKDTRYLVLGRYGEALQRWYAAFPDQQIQLHLFEDFAGNTDKIVKEILEFIDVKPDVKLDLRARHNTSKKNEPRIDSLTREVLINYYQDDVRLLEKIIKRDLSHWLD